MLCKLCNAMCQVLTIIDKSAKTSIFVLGMANPAVYLIKIKNRKITWYNQLSNKATISTNKSPIIKRNSLDIRVLKHHINTTQTKHLQEKRHRF